MNHYYQVQRLLVLADIPKVSYQGGFGHLTLNIYAGHKYYTNWKFFRPAEAGRYEIVFEVIDSIGQKELLSIN